MFRILGVNQKRPLTKKGIFFIYIYNCRTNNDNSVNPVAKDEEECKRIKKVKKGSTSFCILQQIKSTKHFILFEFLKDFLFSD